jgi:multidrug resistance efflux pump
MKLSQMEGGNRVVSLPLRRLDKRIGVMTLEFPPEKPSTPAEATALAVAAELLAPQLYDRWYNDRYLITKAGLSVRDNVKKVSGLRQHTLAKVLTLAAIAGILFLFLYKPTYHVSAPFEFVPEIRRVVDAPFEGQLVGIPTDAGIFVAEVGDAVAKGDPIVKLDTRDLEDERRVQESRQFEALAEADAFRSRRGEGPQIAAQEKAARSRAEAAAAQVAKLDTQISKATITAPIDGVILQIPGGTDLKERIGSVVRPGDPIAIVGTPEQLRIEARVADRDIEDVSVGQTGTLATAALPGEKVALTVTKIVPAAEADPRSQSNAFLVLAEPAEQRPDWLPAASGEIRLDAGNKSLAWQWTHRLADWVRLKLWL